MLTVEILRNSKIEDGVFGIMRAPHLMVYTCEDDWLDNQPGKSCIPAGTYSLERTIYYKHMIETFEVTNVPGRNRILVHAGNTEEDTEGCILVGTRRGRITVVKDEDTGELRKLKSAVVNSRIAHAQFMNALAGVDKAKLIIVWGVGLP